MPARKILVVQAHQADAASSKAARRVLASTSLGNHSDGYRLADDVYLVIVEDGSGRMVNLAGNACAITNSGSAMLEMVLSSNLETATEALAEQFPLASRKYDRTWKAFLVELASQGLVLPPGPKQGSSWSVREKNGMDHGAARLSLRDRSGIVAHA